MKDFNQQFIIFVQFNVYCVGYLAKPVWLSDPVDGRVDIYVVNTDNGVCLLLFVCDRLKSAFFLASTQSIA